MWVVLSTLQDGASPLHVASQNSHHNVCTLLIERGANLNSQTKVGTIIIDDIGSITDQHVYILKAQNQDEGSSYIEHTVSMKDLM